jgi:hypothetical protein
LIALLTQESREEGRSSPSSLVLAPVYNFLSGVKQLPYDNIKIILKVNKKITMRIASVHPTACDRGQPLPYRPARLPKWNFDVLIQKRIFSNDPAGW